MTSCVNKNGSSIKIAVCLVAMLFIGCFAGVDVWAATNAAEGAKTAGSLGISIDWPRQGAGSAGLAEPLKIVLLLTVLAVLPAIVIATTSFTRTIIVLSM